MATVAAINAVKLQLIDEAQELGIDNDVIGAWLDSGLTPTKATLAGWRVIAEKSVMIEDVSESGSSRTNRFFERALEMVNLWQGRADAEDKALVTDPLGRGRISFHTINRV